MIPRCTASTRPGEPSVLIAASLLGLVLGLLAGGSISNLGSVRLRWVALLVGRGHRPVRDGSRPARRRAARRALRLPLLATSFGLLLVGLWANRSYPGMTLAFVGILSNGIVILVNGGYMPIWEPSLIAAGFTPADVSRPSTRSTDPSWSLPPPPRAARRHHPDPGPVDPERRLDRRRLPDGRSGLLPVRQRRPRPERPRRRGGGARSTPGSARSTRAGPACRPRSPRRPRSSGRSSWAAAGRPGIAGRCRTIPVAPPEVAERIRHHPYVRLALNGSFSALWAGQLISIFGDRIHRSRSPRSSTRTTGSTVAGALVVRRRHAAEPVPVAVRRHVRRPLGPQGGPGRQRHPAGGAWCC